MKIYLDMDGVLTDADSYISRWSGISRGFLLENWDKRNEVFGQFRNSQGADFFRKLPTNQKLFWREKIEEWNAQGHTVEILTSYGIIDVQDLGVAAHTGKRDWLNTHFRFALVTGQISRFNGVQNCEQKALFAQPDALLIDDQPGNVEQFRAAGGHAVRYDITDHPRSVQLIEEAVRELSH